jgi:O-antigen ligase
MVFLLIALTLFGTPFFFIPALQLGFEPPKVIFFELLLALLCVFSVFKPPLNGLKRLPQLPFVWLFMGIATLSLVQILLGKAQLMGNVFRFQGVFTLLLLMAWSIISWLYPYKVKTPLLAALLILQGVLILYIGPNQAGRWVGSLGEPNALAAFLVFLSVLLIQEKQWWKWMFITASLFFLILTGSQSGMLALGVVFLTWFCVSRKLLSLKTAVVGCITVTMLALIVPFIQIDSPFENRGDIWKTAAEAGLAHPFIGNGYGNVPQALKQPGLDTSLTVQNNSVDSSHNIVLDWWVQGGVIGLTLFSALLYIVVRSLLHQKNLQKTLLFFAAVIPLLFNPASIAGLVVFWWVIGSSFYSETVPSSHGKKIVV